MLCIAEKHNTRAHETAERDPLGQDSTGTVHVPAPSSTTELDDALVPVAAIKQQLVMEEISRSGEMGGTTYRSAGSAILSISTCTESSHNTAVLQHVAPLQCQLHAKLRIIFPLIQTSVWLHVHCGSMQ